MVSVSVRYLCYQPMDEEIKTWPLRFPSKENPNMEKALFDWPIVLQYDVKAKYRLISRKFSGRKFFSPERSLNQPKATRVCIRSIICSPVFISRSYENRSLVDLRKKPTVRNAHHCIPMTCHYPDLGSASDWLKISHAARPICREMSAAFSTI